MSQITNITNKQSLRIVQPSKRMPSFLLPEVDDPSTGTHTLKQSVISNFEHSQFSVMCRAPFGQILLFEALATFLFVFGCSSINNDQKYEVDALCAVFLLFAICISGSLTGANINPSITFSNFLRKQNKYTPKMIPIYFGGQLIGVVIGLIAAIYINDFKVSPIIPQSTDLIVVLREMGSEIMGTTIMVFFILQITNPNTTFIQNEISGFLSIAFFFYLSIVLCPNSSSFAMNFAITLGLDLLSTLFDSDDINISQGWKWIWLYLIGDIVGVLIATLFYDKVFEPIIKKLREIRRQSLSFSDLMDAEED